MQAVQDFFIGEWYFSVPLIVMSLIAGALVIWRILLNLSAGTDMDDFLPVFQDTLRKRGVKGAVELCKEEKGLIPSRLFVAGLEAADQGAAAMRRSMANETELEITPRLHFLLAPILAMARAEAGGAIDVLAAYRDSGWRDRKAQERRPVGLGAGIV